MGGKNGLDRRVVKVGILDYEFTARGNLFCTDTHWQIGEFVLSSFVYAQNNSSLITEAVKRLCDAKASGLAIKNVFALEIPRELIYYADAHCFPVFLFTDHSLFFEDVIVEVARYLAQVEDQTIAEKHIASLLRENYNGDEITKRALSINHLFRNQIRIAYFICKTPCPKWQPQELFSTWKQSLGIGNATAKYGNGFFYIYSADSVNTLKNIDIVQDIAQKTGLVRSDYYIGVSDPHYFLSHFKEALQQSRDASIYSQIMKRNISYYHEIGVYKLLLPYAKEKITLDYMESILEPIRQYDQANNANLIETVLLYEQHHGNIRAMSEQLCTHDNTVRYRIKKIAELFGRDATDESFIEQLLLAVKLHHIKKVQDELHL